MMSTATRSDAKDIVAAVQSVVGNASKPLSLHEPLFSGNEKAYVTSCIDDGWVSSVGAFVDKFERALASICGAQYAIATVNGTCALHAVLVATGINPGEEVLIPSLTFVATANAVMHAGAIPHFVEVEETSLGVDPLALESYLSAIARPTPEGLINKHTGQFIRALMPVHIFGHPCQLDALQVVADQYGLALIEDATEALGSEIKNKMVGGHGTSVFSFNGNKIVTTGGGGAILVNDETLYRKLKHLTTTAKRPHAWAFEHDAVAWNYRLPNLNAALGCAQLEQLPKFVAAKRALAKRYQQAFSEFHDVQILNDPPKTLSNYWLITLLAKHADAEWLNSALQTLHDEQLLCRPAWKPLHQLPMYAHCPKSDLKLTESLAHRIINLPSSVKLGLAYV